MKKIEKKDFLKIKPYKRWVLENFPFIEEDFDAITMYQMYCKIVEFLNKVIDTTNEVTSEIEKIESAFNTLIDDINDLIDNKFNEIESNIDERFIKIQNDLQGLINNLEEYLQTNIASQNAKIESLEEIMNSWMNEVKATITETTTNLFNELIEQGEINIDLVYNEEDESLTLETTINVGISNGENIGF